MPHRRDFLYRFGTFSLGGLMGAVLAVPGVRYLLSPLFAAGSGAGEYQTLARLVDLKVGSPRLFPVLGDKQDAWVKYPKEPVGSVWLVRQPEGAPTPVVAFSAQCPHAGCPVALAADARTFQCPCHNSSFTLEGRVRNQIPPRGMDTLKIEPIDASLPDAEVRVQFRRFQLGCEEQKPLV